MVNGQLKANTGNAQHVGSGLFNGNWNMKASIINQQPGSFFKNSGRIAENGQKVIKHQYLRTWIYYTQFIEFHSLNICP